MRLGNLLGAIAVAMGGITGCGSECEEINAECDQIAVEITAEVERTGNLPASYYDNGDPATGQPQPCGARDDPSTAHPYYADACNRLRDCLDRYKDEDCED